MRALANIAVVNEEYGICGNVHESAGDNPFFLTCSAAIFECLKDGFEFFSDVPQYPISHPTLEAGDGYARALTYGGLWHPDTEYGRRRIEALALIESRADQFYVACDRLRYVRCADWKPVNRLIASLEYADQSGGICALLRNHLQTNGLNPHGLNIAVRDCLKDGFEHFDDDDRDYPIAHPELSSFHAYASQLLWDEETEYGRRRHAALAHVVSRARRFSIANGILNYVTSEYV